MAKYSYTKDIADFDISQLSYEIEQNSTIITELDYVNFMQPNLDIYFDVSLSAEEEAELNTIVANSPDSNLPMPTGDTVEKNLIVNGIARSTSYQTISRFIYMGKNNVGEIKEIKIVSYMDEGITSYNVRIVDKNNQSNIIAEITGLSNTEDDIVDMGSINNIPSSESRFEIQVKKMGGVAKDSIYVDSISFIY